MCGVWVCACVMCGWCMCDVWVCGCVYSYIIMMTSLSFPLPLLPSPPLSLQENSNTVLQIQRSLQDYEGSLLGPSRIFLKKGMLMKFSRKTLTPRMFFLVSQFFPFPFLSFPLPHSPLPFSHLLPPSPSSPSPSLSSHMT